MQFPLNKTNTAGLIFKLLFHFPNENWNVHVP